MDLLIKFNPVETVKIAERIVPMNNEIHIKKDITSAKKVLSKLLSLRDRQECYAQEIINVVKCD